MEMTIKDYVNSFLKKERITQVEFCEKTGIPLSTIKGMKSRGTNPGLETLKKIRSVYPNFKFMLSDEQGMGSVSSVKSDDQLASLENKTEFASLYSEIKRLLKENTKLHDENVELLRENREIRIENKDLRNKVNELQEEFNSLNDYSTRQSNGITNAEAVTVERAG
ncbi:hypothetical protein [Petrimonas sulfuriphila]|uniref:helix-turn-helix domain-containing protein n=1 Tax=Petrimonas sulfuriphila TaxID=285070 RepID=UPI003EBD61EB